MTTERGEIMVRAAKLRATILSLLAEETLSVPELTAKIAEGDEDSSRDAVYNRVYTQIRFLLEHSLVFRLPNGIDGVPTYSAKESVAHLPPTSTPKDKAKSAIKIDIIKSTGCVRLTIEGLTIEIGVA